MYEIKSGKNEQVLDILFSFLTHSILRAIKQNVQNLLILASYIASILINLELEYILDQVNTIVDQRYML